MPKSELERILEEIHAGIPDHVWDAPFPVRLVFRVRDDGGLVIESDVPGLYLSGEDHAAVLSDLGRALGVYWKLHKCR